MENTMNWDQKALINELTQGRELVKQIQVHLDQLSSSTGELLITKLLCSFDKSLKMLNWVKLEGEPQLSRPTAVIKTESPCSISGSPRGDYNSDPKDKSKKRKILPKWSEKVRACPKTGLEGPLDDGYSWRKYGQKGILGAMYPRGYYRCTYQNIKGCLAMKQVQRCDEDPTIFSVTYQGSHTCTKASHNSIPGQSRNKENQDQMQKVTQQTFINFQRGFEVKSEDLDIKNSTSSSFSFTSTSPINCLKEGKHIVNSSSPIISPTTSESNSSSPHRIDSFNGTNLQTSNSDLDIFSAANLASNPPPVNFDLDFPMYFDSHFPFDAPGFFAC